MDKFMRKFFGEFDSFFNEFEQNSKTFNPLNIVGETKTEKGQDSNGEWVKQTFASNDGTYKITSFVRTSKFTSQSPSLATKIGDLKAELEACVEKQDFEKAAKLRDKIKSIEVSKEKLDGLKKELESAVAAQNFEKAIELRDTIKGLEK